MISEDFFVFTYKTGNPFDQSGVFMKMPAVDYHASRMKHEIDMISCMVIMN